MSIHFKRLLLRANAIFLLAASTGGFLSDVRGIFFGLGPVGRVVAQAPDAGIGFIEAHGLAFILGILLWRAESLRSWHLTAAAIHVLLGTANLVFWSMFVAVDMLPAGYLTTSLHWLFVSLQLTAAATITRSPQTRILQA